MKKHFKKLFNIMCLALLLIFCYNNSSYAGNIGDNPEFNTILQVIIYSPLIIFFILLILFAASREESLKQQKLKQQNDVCKKKYSISNVILYAVIICIIIYSMIFYKNILLAINVIIVTSLVLMIIFLHILCIEKKQNKLEEDEKTRTIGKELIEKKLTMIRDNISLFFVMVTFLGLWENIEPILILLLIFITMSFLILTISSKKLATIIGFIALIINSSIILHYSFVI